MFKTVLRIVHCVESETGLAIEKPPVVYEPPWTVRACRRVELVISQWCEQFGLLKYVLAILGVYPRTVRSMAASPPLPAHSGHVLMAIIYPRHHEYEQLSATVTVRFHETTRMHIWAQVREIWGTKPSCSLPTLPMRKWASALDLHSFCVQFIQVAQAILLCQCRLGGYGTRQPKQIKLAGKKERKRIRAETKQLKKLEASKAKQAKEQQEAMMKQQQMQGGMGRGRGMQPPGYRGAGGGLPGGGRGGW